MKIKLISPRMSLRPMDSEYKRLLSPSVSLLIVAAMTPKKHHVWVEDENARKLHLDDRPDLVGITVNVDTSLRAYEIAQRYRNRGVPVVLGGIHASACPDEGLQYANAVCIGEAEDVWKQILSDCENRALKQRYYNDQPTDLARVPIPRWELLDKSRYLYSNIVNASRSCCFQCEFCYNSCGYVHHIYRNRPVANVVEEIRHHDTRQIMFIDDNFIGNPEWTREFVRAIKDMDLTWHAAVSANIGAYPDLLDEMQASGCRSLFIGFESINSDSVASVSKRQNKVERYETTIREIHDRRIMINASMAFGFDHDRPSVFRETLDWLIANKIETMTGHILTPYPGTRLYLRLLSEGRIVDHNPSHYNTSHVVFEPRLMSREQLLDGYLWIYDQFYALDSVFRRMPEDSGRRVPYLLFNLGYRKYGKLTSLVARFGLMNAFGRLARRLAYGIE